MHRNPYWLAFLTILIGCALGYTGHTLFKVYQYQRFNARVPVQSIQWTVDYLGEDKFVPKAHYQFKVRDLSYEGQTSWEEHYLNAWSAKEAADRLSQQPWKVWIDSTHPAYSSLQKNFPLKESLSAITLWFLLVYFVGLGQYVTKYK